MISFSISKAFIQTDIYITDNPDELSENNEFLQNFRYEYVRLINSMVSEIKKIIESRQKKIYQAQGTSGGNIAPGEGHTAIRKELTELVYKKVSEMLSANLGSIIWSTINKMLEWINQRMWYIEGIQKTLLADSEENYKLLIFQKIETLILRLSRPAIDLFLRFPRHDNRIKTIKQYKNEVIIMDIFYKENNVTKKRGLPSYLANGKFKDDLYVQLEFDADKLEPEKQTTSLPEVVQQIKDDVEEFSNYMIYSIYYGSGIEAFFKQEIDKIIHAFKLYEQNALRWQHYVFNALEKGNSKIPFRKFENDIESKRELFNSIVSIEKELK